MCGVRVLYCGSRVAYCVICVSVIRCVVSYVLFAVQCVEYVFVVCCVSWVACRVLSVVFVLRVACRFFCDVCCLCLSFDKLYESSRRKPRFRCAASAKW